MEKNKIMNDIKIWDKMLLEDLDTSILVEQIGLQATIKAYREGKEQELLNNILDSNKDH